MTQTYLAKDRFNHAIQVLKPGVAQSVVVSAGGAAKAANAFSADTVVIRVISTVDVYVSVGTTASAVASAGSLYLPALLPEYFRVDQLEGYTISALGVAGGGTLNVTEMA